MPKNERTLKMRENFMADHKNGLSLKDIAKKYGISTPTVYGELQWIADQNGVSRESLLQTPHDEHIGYTRTFEPVEKIDLTEFHQHLSTAMSEIDAAIQSINKEIEKHETLADNLNQEVQEWKLTH